MERFTVTIPNVLLDSLEEYIKHGGGDVTPSDTYQKQYPDDNYLDIKTTSLMRYLVSKYGDCYTPEADYLNSDLVAYETKNKWTHKVTIRTSNQRMIDNKASFVTYLIRAMVWEGIPIIGYFDGYHLIGE